MFNSLKKYFEDPHTVRDEISAVITTRVFEGFRGSWSEEHMGKNRKRIEETRSRQSSWAGRGSVWDAVMCDWLVRTYDKCLNARQIPMHLKVTWVLRKVQKLMIKDVWYSKTNFKCGFIYSIAPVFFYYLSLNTLS